MAVTFTTPSRDDLQKFLGDDARTLRAFEALFDLLKNGKILAPGDITYSAGTTRIGALPADGASLLRAEYPDLFAAIGTTYGFADATHFNAPNLAGRVIAGKEATATLITTAVSGFSGATLGATGGLQSHTLVTAEMPAHAHALSQNALYQAGANANMSFSGPDSLSAFGTTASTGGGGAHRNVQPTIILNAFIIF